MESPTQLQRQLEELRGIRALGAEKVRFADNREVTYRTGPDLDAAIADLERRINQSIGGRVTTVRLSSSKGF